jgi:nicotinate-nucleotide adenylyltransferase
VKLGIFGGTFDPPHLGHLILAENARDQLQLDRVLWVVAGQSPLKQDRSLTPAPIRVALVQATIAGNPAFALSRVDLDRPAPHFTIDTLKLLGADFPSAELYFLMGEDSLRDLPRWKDPVEIIRLARLVVSQRPGAEMDLSEIESAVPGVSTRVCWLNAPQLEIASSDIQQRVREGRTVRYMLPQAVEEIVRQEGLYKNR